jgi:hypothetical protein
MAGRAHADAGSEGLPQANVKRVVKEKLAELAHAHFDDDRKEKDVLVNKDALLAFSESAKIFIHFLSATYVRDYSLSLNLSVCVSLCVSLSLCFSFAFFPHLFPLLSFALKFAYRLTCFSVFEFLQIVAEHQFLEVR